MVFSSPTFLLVFLPVVIFGSFLCGRHLRNLFLLIASLIFYAWGEAVYVLIMLFSILMNYVFGLLLGSNDNTSRWGKLILTVGVCCNLTVLLYYKYANFIVDNLDLFFNALGVGSIDLEPVHLPLGISFFTFQAISYLIEVYRREAPRQDNIINIALYIALFPQLIAGPIVRYQTVAQQITERVITLKLASSGLQRFIYGLAKKVLIANPMGQLADTIFALPPGELTTELAWLGLVCYTLQIYFDFSGYSDMAIGLGRMFGFKFLENFNYPYIATSLRDFWRRWHISLSSWFRDYLYIPLGGNQKGAIRTYFNLVTVFLLCGLWHGASWNFVIWGLIHGFFLVLERLGLAAILLKLPLLVRHLYTVMVVMLAWVFFRAETLPEATHYLSVLLGQDSGDGVLHYPARYLNIKIALIIGVGILLATPWMKQLNARLISHAYVGQRLGVASAYSLSNLVLLAGLFLMCMLSLASSAYNPFIYFRF